MKNKILLLSLGILLSNAVLAKSELFVYQAKKMGIKATVTIKVKDIIQDGQARKEITSVTTAKALFKTVYTLRFKGITTAEIQPIVNAECEYKKGKNICKRARFVGHQQFIYKKSSFDTKEVPFLSPQEPHQLFDINDQWKDFDQDRDNMYDLATFVLGIKNLNLTPAHPSKQIYLIIGSSVHKIKINLVQKLSRKEQLLSVTEFNASGKSKLPEKIIYNTKKRIVTQISQRFPVVGLVEIKLKKHSLK